MSTTQAPGQPPPRTPIPGQPSSHTPIPGQPSSRTVGHEGDSGGAPQVTRTGSSGRWHAPFLAAEAVLLVLATALAVIVAHHYAPLPGDVGLALAEQHLILPHAALTQALDAVSTINWPIPSAVTLVVVTIILLVMRRRLAAVLALLVAGLADGSSYLTNELVRRPRPSDHGLHVLQHITNYYSFPSGHVIHALAFWGFVVFVTYQVRRPAAWVWVVRVVLVLLIVLMAPSRVLEGEHWPSDVLEGLLYGAFWLIAGMHAYHWAGSRWPRLRGRHEQDTETDGEPAGHPSPRPYRADLRHQAGRPPAPLHRGRRAWCPGRSALPASIGRHCALQ